MRYMRDTRAELGCIWRCVVRELDRRAFCVEFVIDRVTEGIRHPPVPVDHERVLVAPRRKADGDTPCAMVAAGLQSVEAGIPTIEIANESDRTRRGIDEDESHEMHHLGTGASARNGLGR